MFQPLLFKFSDLPKITTVYALTINCAFKNLGSIYTITPRDLTHEHLTIFHSTDILGTLIKLRNYVHDSILPIYNYATIDN